MQCHQVINHEAKTQEAGKILSYMLLCGRVVKSHFPLVGRTDFPSPIGIQVCDLGGLVVALKVSIHRLELVPATAWVSIWVD